MTTQPSPSSRTLFGHPIGLFTLFFTEAKAVRSWDDAKGCDTARFGRFHAAMLAAGVYLPPSQFEAAFVSGVHGDAELDRTLTAARDAVIA